jgi:hypothetical protein
LTSNEYLQAKVTGFYTLYLGVSPTRTQVAQGLAALQHESSEQYLASLLGTRRYFDQHPGVPGQTLRSLLRRGKDRSGRGPGLSGHDRHRFEPPFKNRRTRPASGPGDWPAAKGLSSVQVSPSGSMTTAVP